MISRRVDRTIRLLQLLQQNEGIALQQLADWLNCSPRTVYRDLHVLRESGFRVEWSAAGYRVTGSTKTPQGFLEGDEVLALLIAVNSSPYRSTDGLLLLARRALQKLVSTSPAETQERWKELSRAVSVDESEPAPLSAYEVNALPLVAKAIESRTPLKRLNRVPATDGNANRGLPDQIIPERLVPRDGAWCVQGRDAERGVWMQLNLDELDLDESVRAPIGPMSYPMSIPVASVSDAS